MTLRSFALSMLFLSAVSLAAPTVAQQTGPSGRQDARQAVEAFVAQYTDAYNRKDAARVASLYAEDGIVVPPAPIAIGRQNIEAAWRAVFAAGLTGLRYNVQEVRTEGNLVWAVGRFTVSAPDESGTLRERQGNFAILLQWEGGDLRFRVHAFNVLAPLPSPRPR